MNQAPTPRARWRVASALLAAAAVIALTACASTLGKVKADDWSRQLKAIDGVIDAEVQSSTSGFPSSTLFYSTIYVDTQLTTAQADGFRDRYCSSRLAGTSSLIAEAELDQWALSDDRFDEYCDAPERLGLFTEISHALEGLQHAKQDGLNLEWVKRFGSGGAEIVEPTVTVRATSPASLVEIVRAVAPVAERHPLTISAAVAGDDGSLRGAKYVTLAPGSSGTPQVFDVLPQVLLLDFEAVQISEGVLELQVSSTEMLHDSTTREVVDRAEVIGVDVKVVIPPPPGEDEATAFRAYVDDLRALSVVKGLDLCSYECGLITTIRVHEMQQLDELLTVVSREAELDSQVTIRRESAEHGLRLVLATGIDLQVMLEAHRAVLPVTTGLPETGTTHLTIKSGHDGEPEVSLRAFLPSDISPEVFEEFRGAFQSLQTSQLFSNISISQDAGPLVVVKELGETGLGGGSD